MIRLLILFMALLSFGMTHAETVALDDVVVKTVKSKDLVEYHAFKGGELESTLSFRYRGEKVELSASFPGKKTCYMTYYDGGDMVRKVDGDGGSGNWMWLVLACLHGEVGYTSSNGWHVLLQFDCLRIADSVQIEAY